MWRHQKRASWAPSCWALHSAGDAGRYILGQSESLMQSHTRSGREAWAHEKGNDKGQDYMRALAGWEDGLRTRTFIPVLKNTKSVLSVLNFSCWLLVTVVQMDSSEQPVFSFFLNWLLVSLKRDLACPEWVDQILVGSRDSWNLCKMSRLLSWAGESGESFLMLCWSPGRQPVTEGDSQKPRPRSSTAWRKQFVVKNREKAWCYEVMLTLCWCNGIQGRASGKPHHCTFHCYIPHLNPSDSVIFKEKN